MDGYHAGKDGTERVRAVVHFRVGWMVQSRWDGWSVQDGCYSAGRKDGAVEGQNGWLAG